MNNIASLWSKPPKNLVISNQEVHIWRIFIDIDSPIIKTYLPILSIDEQEKANRFCFLNDRNRFITVRSILRRIIGYYIGKSPRELKFNFNQYGKPFLSQNSSTNAIKFNVSHSHEIALIAVNQDFDIGVDVEYIHTNFDFEGIVERFFSVNEKNVWRSLPNYQKVEAFFNCWTRKEAFIKAKGKGLSLPLNEFDVSFKPGEPASLLNTAWDKKEVDDWSVEEIKPAYGYVGALAVEASNLEVKFWQWSDNCFL
jgi:4'-phosphopantetheinyl transferase